MNKKTKFTLILLVLFVSAGVAMSYIPQLNFIWVSIIVIAGLIYFIKGKAW